MLEKLLAYKRTEINGVVLLLGTNDERKLHIHRPDRFLRTIIQSFERRRLSHQILGLTCVHSGTHIVCR